MHKLIMILVLSGLQVLYSQVNQAEKLMQVYDRYALAPLDLKQMKHAFLLVQLQKIAGLNKTLQLQAIGESVEQRIIYKISFGQGHTRVLLWSQMHGDEPTATAALLAVFNYLARNGNEPMVRQIYDQLTIHAVPMLNPDGAENFQRRNAQDIDINRDVRAQTTPEGQLLVRLREEIKPDFGFNLHDMMGREMVGETKKALYLAFMAPPFNKENEDTDTRIRAKQLVVFLKNLLDPFIPDHIARYKADFMPRAFGDAMQNWGVSTVLIESGLNDTSDPHFLVKLNFLALLSSFQTLATGQLNGIDHTLYDQIPLEGVPLVDLLICNALIYNGMSIPPFKADIGINIETKTVEGKEIREGSIVDIGDLAITTGLNIIEGENLVVTPGRIARIKEKTDVKDLVKNGITTAVVTTAPADTTASEFYYTDSTQTLKLITMLSDSGFTTADQIVNYSSFAAAALKLTKLGQVKRDHQADLLIFNGQTGNRLDLSSLIYVIKNGVVISMKK